MTSSAVDESFAVTLPRRPYPGLRPFTKDEWPIFFGRERMADDIFAGLIEKRLLVVHGDSGCGKSSVVAAAVLPRLEHESARGGLRWITCTTRPGDAPLWNLATDLAELAGGAKDEAAIEIRRRLNFGADAPAAVAELIRRDRRECVCLVVDQFEELFAHADRRSLHEAQLATGLLTSFKRAPPDGFYIVLTMRSEFLGACARFENFAETVNASQYLLPRLHREDLLRAIREPAALYNGEIARPLADRLIADAGGDQDQLPLMQHGLMLLYRDHVERRGAGGAQPADDPTARPWQIGLDGYTHHGGLKKLLSDHADGVMQDALQRAGLPPTSRVVEDMFRTLTDINAEGQAVRRPRTFAQLAEVTGADRQLLRSIVDVFRAEGASFLRPYGDQPIRDDTLIDISHEALIRCWQKIAEPSDGWLIREFRNGLIWRSLLVQADSFARDATNVLASTTADERARWIRRRNDAWSQRYGGGWERVNALIDASIAARDRERRSKLRYRLGLAAAVSVLIGLAVAFVVSSLQERAARLQEQANDAEQMQTTIANSAKLAAADDSQRKADIAAVAEQLRKLEEQIRTAPAPAARPAYAAREIDSIATKLSETAQTAPAAAAGPRVYVHITDDKYRDAARAFERLFEAETIDNVRIVVPGIELVKSYPPKSVLRCFREDECANEGNQLVRTANQLLRAPHLTLQDMSSRYGQSSSIRPHHYEIWFVGDITVAK